MTLTNFPNGLTVGEGDDLNEIIGGLLSGLGRINFDPQELTVSGAIDPNVTLVELNHASTIIAATRVAPVKGDVLVITNTSASGTTAHTVTLPSGVTWDGTNRVATLDAPNEALICYASSPTRYRVLVNVGSVAFS